MLRRPPAVPLVALLALCASCGGGSAPPPSPTPSATPSPTPTPSPSPTPTPTPTAGAGSDGIFTVPNAWTQPVDGATLHPQSREMIAQLVSQGGFGFGRFQIDFGITVLEAVAGTPHAPFVPSGGYYTPDCDDLASVPLPAGGAIEAQPGYACDVTSNDCHLLVVDRGAARLYEVYQANVDGSGRLQGLCAVAWKLDTTYPADLRGDQCTSADAAGLPIAPLLFSADEVAAGSIDHAVRFILPNARIRAGAFVRPATHAGAPSGPSGAVPYGVRLRLRGDFPLASLPGEGPRVVARALQRYGMILADGGNVALTARDDRFTRRTWAEVGIGSHSLEAITAADFEVVDFGTPVPLTYDCVRNGR